MDNIHNIINDTADNPPVPAPEILSNELILEHIFKNLRVRDLKHCRGVNILWCREATNSLLKIRELFPIEIDKGKNGNFQFRINKAEHSMNTEDFVAMVTTSISFPCNNIFVWSYALKNTSFQFFLKNYGGNIRQLEIWNDPYEDEELQGPIVKTIEDFLTRQDTKLKCLKIPGGSISILASTQFLDDLKLKYLTKLIVGASCTYKSNEFLGRILNAAVNLKIVTFDHDYRYQYISSAIFVAILGFEKAHLLDRCDFFIEPSLNIEEQIKIYEAVVSSKPKLNTISLGMSTLYVLSEDEASLFRFASIISKCLELNSENLVDIQFFDNFLHLPGLRIPRLAKVKSLESLINALRLMEGNLLALSFVETFPNLKSIAFSSALFINNEEVSNYLGNVIPCLYVTKCDYVNFFPNSLPPALFEYFGEKFPNLTHLKCRMMLEFLEASQNIWRSFTQLEFLEIQIGHTTASVEVNYPGLEAAFTGFSSQVCLCLKNCITEGRDVNVEFPNLEELRMNPSILSLKKLTFLEVTFDNKGISSDSWKNWAPTSPLLTAVTGQFAFALCPTLRVNINIWTPEGDSNAWSIESNPFLGVQPFLNMMNFENDWGI